MSDMRGKLLLTRPGGGAKTEIRPNQRGEGWLVIEFEYDDDGKRTKTNETRAASHEHVLGLLKQDDEFYGRFMKLAEAAVTL